MIDMTRPRVSMREVLDYILAHPETHDQSIWGEKGPECNTTMCFAGHTSVTFAGDEPIWERYDDAYSDPAPPESAWYFSRVITSDGVEMTVKHRAAELLGLTPHGAEILFDPLNNIDDLAALVESHEAGRPIYAVK
jgi:hypothetical protein